MSDPYGTPETSGDVPEDEKLRQYWREMKRRRNSFYLYFFLAGPVLNALVFVLVFNLDTAKAIDAIGIGISVLYFLGLFWFGFRLTDIHCYQCQHKLAMGHFFLLRNVHCAGCGFRFTRNK